MDSVCQDHLVTLACLAWQPERQAEQRGAYDVCHIELSTRREAEMATT